MYRIITDGKKFKIEKKGWFFWNIIQEESFSICPSSSDIATDIWFISLKDAQNYIDEFKREFNWRVVETHSLV